MEIPPDKQGPPATRARRPAAVATLKAGTVIAGRYEIISVEAPSPFGTTYDALDREARHTVFVRHVNPELLARAPGGAGRLREELAAIAKVKHKNLAHILDFHAGPEGVFVVTDHVEGLPLRAFLSKRRQAGAIGLSLKSAVNVLAHVLNGLGALHQVGAHGALAASNIYVNQAGRVKLLDLGFARALPGFGTLVASEDRPAVAPETLKGHAADVRTDVYAIGAILYELLTGKPPVPGGAKVSVAVPGLPVELDQAIARCLSQSPGDRPGDIGKIKQALWQLVDSRGAAASQAMSAKAVAAAAAGRASGQHLVARGGGPGAPVVDETEEKWLVSKGKLDFGPYSFIQIKELIARDEVILGHSLIDNDRGDRMNVEDHPRLHDLVMAAAQRREDARRVHVETQAVQQHKRSGRALFAFIGVGVLGIGVAAYFIIGAVKGSDKTERNTDISALDRAALKDFKVGGAKRVTGKKRSGPRPSSGGPASEEALSFDMDDDAVGDERLDDNQINQVIGANGGSLAKCLLEESRRGGSRSADIEFSVKGTGRVSFVRVNGETKGPLASCVYGKMSGWRFPEFNGARTRASFSMNL